MLGVGYTPARVIATAEEGAVEEPIEGPARKRPRSRRSCARSWSTSGESWDWLRAFSVAEEDDSVQASFFGGDLGLLIGRRGATIDPVQYLVNAMVFRRFGDDAKQVTVDAARYRERRRATLESLAEQDARVRGERANLEPMSAPERKIIHLRPRTSPASKPRARERSRSDTSSFSRSD